MSSSRPAALALTLVCGCSGFSGAPSAPAPARLAPASGYTFVEQPVTVAGVAFDPAVNQALGRGGALQVDASFRAFLTSPGGPVELLDVRWVDAQTLAGRVPANLAPGVYGVAVEGPYGRGTKDAVYRASAGPRASLAVQASAPALVIAGDAFAVQVQASNAGAVTARGLSLGPLQVEGLSLQAGAPVDLEGQAEVTLPVQARALVPGAYTLRLPVSAIDEIDGSAVTATATASFAAQAPAALAASAAPLPASADVDQPLDLAIQVRNSGGTTAQQLTPTLDGGLDVLTAAAPQDVAAGATATFLFTVRGRAPGRFEAGCTFSGTQDVDGAALQIPRLALGAVNVVTPASLAIGAVALPASVSVGQLVGVDVPLQNAGGAAAAGASVTLAGLPVVQGAAQADVPGTTTLPFHFVLQPQAAGSTTMTAQAAASDANTGAQLAAGPVTLGALVVQTPPALSAQLTSARATVDVGQTFTAQLAVSNAGQAAAVSVAPSQLQLRNAQLVSASPAQTIAGGATASWTLTLTATAAGSIAVTAGASGADANSGATVTAAPAAVSLLGQTPAQLQITSFTLPASLSAGQQFTATMMVSNSGDADALTVVAPLLATSGAFSTVSAPPAVTVPGHATATLQWTLQDQDAGAALLALSASASAVDANTGAAVSSPAAQTQTAVVQRPAALTAGFTLQPQLTAGQHFTATLLVTNTGEATAVGVLPDPRTISDGTDVTSPQPQPVDLAGGQTASFTFTFTAGTTGSLTLADVARAADANSGAPLQASASTRSNVVNGPSLTIVSWTVPQAVSRGQTFAAQLTVQNVGDAQASGVSPLPAPPALVLTGGAAAQTASSPAAIDLAPGAQGTFSWSYVENGTAAGSIALSGGGAGLDPDDGAAVSAPAVSSGSTAVQEPAALAATLTAPAFVSTGQTFPVSLTVQNTGGASAGNLVVPPPSVSGATTSDPAGTAQTLAGQASTTFTWQFTESGSNGALAFSAAPTATDANSTAPLSATASAATTVQTPATLLISAFSVPSSVVAGQPFMATVVLANTGQATANFTLPPPATGGGVTVSGSAATGTIPGGGSASFNWSFQTTSSTSDSTVTLTQNVSGSDANSGAALNASAPQTLQVLAPSTLQITSFTLPARVSRGQQFAAILTVQNTGSNAASNVTPGAFAVQRSGSANATVVTSPSAAASLASGASTTFTWMLQENGTGTGTLTASANATGTVLGTLMTAPATTTAAAVVQEPAALTITAVSAPASVDRGQSFTVTVTVANTGGADAVQVVPALGTSNSFSVTGSPSAVSLAAGASRTFSFNVQENGNGSPLSFTATATGKDANSNAALSAGPSAAVTTVVQQAAQLNAVSLAVPQTIDSGQSFTAVLTVRNGGGAAALVDPPVLAINGPAKLTVSPPGNTVAGGASGTFTFSLVQTGANSKIQLTASVTGKDANTGSALGQTSANGNIQVQTPAALSIGSVVLTPSPIDQGQSFTAQFTVTNTGQATATGVLPASPALAATGGANVALTGAPAAARLAGGASQTFTYAYRESGSGPGTLQLSTSASGIDANTGSAVTSAAASSPALDVLAPASLSGALHLPTVMKGDTFSVTLALSDTGGDSAVSVNATLTMGGTATLKSGASPSLPITIAAGQTASLTWTFIAETAGTLTADATVSGQSQASSAAISAAASASGTVEDVLRLATDPFGDGTSFSFVFGYANQIWLGPRKDGTGAVSMNADGSGLTPVTMTFARDTGLDVSFYGGTFTSIGAPGCQHDTAACGPDNEDDRAWFGSFSLNGTEWLAAAGAARGGGTRHFYATSTTGTALQLPYVDYFAASTLFSTGDYSITAMHALGSRLYIGFATGKPETQPLLTWLDLLPSSPPGVTPTVNDFADLHLDRLSYVSESNSTIAVIDAITDFNGLLYVADAAGCARSVNGAPRDATFYAGDWASCTPTGWGSTSYVETKATALAPADKAAPAFAVFGNHLYLGRNTTAGPQLWSCTPSNGTACAPADWTLIDPNKFTNTTQGHLSMLVATPQRLYVGFDGTGGIAIFRSLIANPLKSSDFAQVGSLGLGANLVTIGDAKSLFDAGVYLTAAPASGGFSVYRLPQ